MGTDLPGRKRYRPCRQDGEALLLGDGRGDFRADEVNRRRSVFFRGERLIVPEKEEMGEIEDLGRKE